MKNELLKEIHSLKENFLADLKKIIQVESVKSNPAPNAPFGVGPKEALVRMLEIAQNLGFETKIVANAVGYVQLGEGIDYIGVIGHLDVVPSGDLSAWNYPAFDLTQIDDMLYGRGVLDNKGPILSCLYGLYVLKKLQMPLCRPIRVLFGTDEESGSADIKMYLEHESPPIFGFTPDCKYPVVYGEMGYLNITITCPITDESHRMVDNFQIDAHVSKIPEKLSFKIKDENVIYITGKSAPTNAPDLADNVILKFAQTLVVSAGTEFKTVLLWITEKFNQEGTGNGFGFKKPVMPVPYDIRINDTQVELDVVVRYDVKITQEALMKQMRSQMKEGYQMKINRAMPSTLMDKSLPEIQVMSEIYESLTGLDGTPVTTTGATYARWMPNVVAFGPSMPGQKAIAHLPNEWMKVSDLMKNFEIYTLAMYELAK